MALRIAILYPISEPWVARVMDGVRLYAETRGGWHIFGSPPSLHGSGESALPIRSFRGWKGDGIMIASNEAAEIRFARRLGIPTVNLAGGLAVTYGVPRVMVDHYAAGRMAAEHLLERGLTSLAFFGWEDLWYSQERHRGFSTRAAESGIDCAVLLRPTDEDIGQSWAQRIAVAAKWLSRLPLPCGTFAVHDYRAQLLVEACYEAGLRVPEDIAVVGMDNNEILCEHSVPKLSSISRNSSQVGFEAAALLHRMINGEPFSTQELLIPPSEVVLRKSSDMMYCADPLVRRAIEYMRNHLKGNFNIEAVAEHLGISKRKLERRFPAAVNSSPHQYLTKLRVTHAQSLMQLESQQTLEDIARESGFGTMPTFYAAFRRETGETPATILRKKTNKGMRPANHPGLSGGPSGDL